MSRKFSLYSSTCSHYFHQHSFAHSMITHRDFVHEGLDLWKKSVPGCHHIRLVM